MKWFIMALAVVLVGCAEDDTATQPQAEEPQIGIWITSPQQDDTLFIFINGNEYETPIVSGHYNIPGGLLGGGVRVTGGIGEQLVQEWQDVVDSSQFFVNIPFMEDAVDPQNICCCDGTEICQVSVSIDAISAADSVNIGDWIQFYICIEDTLH